MKGAATAASEDFAPDAMRPAINPDSTSPLPAVERLSLPVGLIMVRPSDKKTIVTESFAIRES